MKPGDVASVRSWRSIGARAIRRDLHRRRRGQRAVVEKDLVHATYLLRINNAALGDLRVTGDVGVQHAHGRTVIKMQLDDVVRVVPERPDGLAAARADAP